MFLYELVSHYLCQKKIKHSYSRTKLHLLKFYEYGIDVFSNINYEYLIESKQLFTDFDLKYVKAKHAIQDRKREYFIKNEEDESYIDNINLKDNVIF